MSLTILIRFRVVIFVVTIIASTFTTRLDFTVHVEASEIRSTNKKHFRQGPNKGKPGMFGAQGKKYRTRIIEAPKRGMIASLSLIHI